jgi:hypothetical protein
VHMFKINNIGEPVRGVVVQLEESFMPKACTRVTGASDNSTVKLHIPVIARGCFYALACLTKLPDDGNKVILITPISSV